MGLEPTTSENMAQCFIPNEASGQTDALTHEIGGGGEGSNLPSAMQYLYNLYMLLVPVQCGRKWDGQTTRFAREQLSLLTAIQTQPAPARYVWLW